MNEVNFIFLKRTGCPHCEDFQPIFDELHMLLKKELENKGTSFNIIIYDIIDTKEYDKFKTDFPHINNWFVGVPSMFIDSKINKKIRFGFIDLNYPKKPHLLNNEEKKGVAKDILEKFMNKYKKFTSQEGGNNYINKYLKYKNKYLFIKNNN
jgi:hypothetical protein